MTFLDLRRVNFGPGKTVFLPFLECIITQDTQGKTSWVRARKEVPRKRPSSFGLPLVPGICIRRCGFSPLLSVGSGPLFYPKSNGHPDQQDQSHNENYNCQYLERGISLPSMIWWVQTIEIYHHHTVCCGPLPEWGIALSQYVFKELKRFT